MTGDLTYAAYSCADLITNRLASGDPLDDVEREAGNALEFVQKMRFGLISDLITTQLRLIRMLRGLTPDFTSFNDAEFDEVRFEQHLESNPQLAIAASRYWIRKLQACVYAGDGASAVAAALKAAPLLWTVPSQVELSEYHFYAALARAAHCDMASAEERPRHLDALAAHHQQITLWAKNCPATFANRAALIGAEIARLEGRELDAMRLYEEAIRSAREHGFIQNEGLGPRTRRAVLRGARLRDDRPRLSAERTVLLSPLGRRRQGAAARATASAPQRRRSQRSLPPAQSERRSNISTSRQ